MDDWADTSHHGYGIVVHEGDDTPEWYDTGILDPAGDPIYGRIYRPQVGFIHRDDE